MRTNIGGFGVTEGILMNLLYMVAIAYTDSEVLKVNISNLVPIQGIPPSIGEIKILDIGIIFIFINALKYSYLNITCGLEKS